MANFSHKANLKNYLVFFIMLIMAYLIGYTIIFIFPGAVGPILAFSNLFFIWLYFFKRQPKSQLDEGMDSFDIKEFPYLVFVLVMGVVGMISIFQATDFFIYLHREIVKFFLP